MAGEGIAYSPMGIFIWSVARCLRRRTANGRHVGNVSACRGEDESAEAVEVGEPEGDAVVAAFALVSLGPEEIRAAIQGLVARQRDVCPKVEQPRRRFHAIGPGHAAAKSG